MIFLQLFIVFFEIGIFGFGGGYGILSIIQAETVVHYHWMTSAEIANIIAISQMTPGPIAVNAATYCGYAAVHNAGMGTGMAILGSTVATLALILPSFILMTLVAKVLLRYMNTPVVQSIFMILRPAVVGLLAAATLLLCTPDNFNSPSVSPWHFWISIALFAATFVDTKWIKINPILMIAFAAFAGLLLLY